MILNNNNKLVFISDDPALKSKGSGLSVLLFNVLLALKHKDPTLITFCGNSKASVKEIMDDNEGIKVIVCDAKFSSLNNVRIIKRFISAFSFIISLRRIGAIINNSNILVVIPVGASVRPIWKFLLLKSFFKKARYGLYIVDDLQSINNKLSNRLECLLIKNLLPKAIKNSDFLINIGYGLRDTYLKQYGKDSYILLPHFIKRKPLIKNNPTHSFTFLFTGGLSFLYNAPLLELEAVLDDINQSGICNKELRLLIQTYTHKKEFDRLGFKSPSTFYSTVSNRDDLLNIYNSCQCFVIPYSFDVADKQIVKTSFPQKVAEIIQYKRPILVYGPDYSSVVQFFNNNSLGYVCDSQTKQKLTEIILQIVDQYEQFDGENYVKAYESLLSADMVNAIFDDILNTVI
jgi:glycosyltransferase involved in cell wall biosynthesis